MTRQCESADAVTEFGVELYVARCPNDATRHVLAGCVHEHLTSADVCDKCRPDPVNDVGRCTVCFRAGHECKLLTIEDEPV